jgi:hypothetical protein
MHKGIRPRKRGFTVGYALKKNEIWQEPVVPAGGYGITMVPTPYEALCIVRDGFISKQIACGLTQDFGGRLKDHLRAGILPPGTEEIAEDYLRSFGASDKLGVTTFLSEHSREILRKLGREELPDVFRPKTDKAARRAGWLLFAGVVLATLPDAGFIPPYREVWELKVRYPRAKPQQP